MNRPADPTTVAAMPAEHTASWQLITAARTGDVAAFAAFYRRYTPSLRNYLAARIANVDLVDDLVSETFLRALRGMHTLTYQGRDVSAWLTTIAANLLRDHHKSARHRYETLKADAGISAPASATPETVVLRAAEANELADCINQLTADQRQCLLLRFFYDHSIADTATTMCRDVNAVKALQHRAIRRLTGLLTAM